MSWDLDDVVEEKLSSEGRPAYSWRLDVSYIGETFHGFQSQPDGKTIQDHLEKALSRLLGVFTHVVGGSRTDSGVHAEQQVCIFTTADNIDTSRTLRALNALVPSAIKCYSLKQAEQNFHPHRSSTGKIYRYRIWRGYCLDPFSWPYVWEVQKNFDTDIFKEQIAKFIGTHDFCAFANSGGKVRSTKRTIFEIDTVTQGPLLDVWIHGNGFLKQMVRNMVGTAAAIALGKLSSDVVKIINSQDRRLAGRTAPAKGLCLVRSNFVGHESSVKSEIDLARSAFSRQLLHSSS